MGFENKYKLHLMLVLENEGLVTTKRCCQTCREKERVPGNTCAKQILIGAHFHQWPNDHVQTKDALMGHFGIEGSTPIVLPRSALERTLIPSRPLPHSLSHSLVYPTLNPSCPSPDTASIKSIPKLPPRGAQSKIRPCVTADDEGVIPWVHRG